MKLNTEDILAEYCFFPQSNACSQSDKPDLTAYYKLVEEKEAYRENWNCLKQDLKESGRFGRVRDMEFSTEPHAFKVVLPVYDSGHQGIIFCISMMKKYIGIYFSDYQKEALVPIMNCTTPLQVSYYPFSPQQEEQARVALDIATRHFPDFQKFDNTYAGLPVGKVTIGADTYNEIDLFQAVFSTNVHGMI